MEIRKEIGGMMTVCGALRSLLLCLAAMACVTVMADSGVGTPKGEFSVSESGAGVYSLPVDIFPSGTGFDPQIGIAYNSQQNGYGNVGYGVSITGVSCITRAGSDLFHDNDVQKVKYEAGDNYLLDGKRLYLKDGSRGADGSTYTVEGNPYATVTLHGADSQGNTSAWFELKDADGNVYQFKKMLRCYFEHLNQDYRTVAWYITKATNKYNDCISYSYTQSGYVLYPYTITYGRGSVTHSIAFAYTSLQNPQKFRIEGGMLGSISRKLQSITAYCGTDVYRKYTFSYDSSSDASQRKYDRLTAVNVANGSGESLKPITLAWNHLKEANIQKSCASVKTELSTGLSGGTDEGYSYYYSADINNDGISDIIRLWHGNVYYYTSNAKQHQHAVYLYISKSQVDANGKVTYQNPIRYDFQTLADLGDDAYIAAENILEGHSICNIDGDCYNDLILPYYYVWNKNKYCTFYLLKGYDANSGNASQICNTSILLTSGEEMPLYCNADLNGDGKDEFLIVEQKKSNDYYYAHLIFDLDSSDKSNKTVNLQFQFSLNKDIKNMFLADCNADGLQDIILVFENGYKIYFNNGGKDLTAVFSESNSKELSSSSTLKYYWRMEQGDFNGDGLLDFVVCAAGKEKLSFLCNNGNGTFTLTGETEVDFSENTNSDEDDAYFTVRVADFDKDGRSDVLVSKKHLYLFVNKMDKTQVRWFLSDGTKPVLWKSIDKGDKERDCAEAYIFTGDFDGDGYAEIANYGSDLTSDTDDFTDNTINVYSFPTDVALGHVASITNGFGKKTDISYSCGTDPSVYTAGNSNDCCYPVNTYTLPLALVSKVTQTNGACGSESVSYSYGDLRAHVQGRGLMGFSNSTAVYSRGGNTETVSKSISWDGKVFVPASATVTTSIGGKTSTVVSENAIAYGYDADGGGASWNGNFFSYCSKSISTDFDGHGTTKLCGYYLDKGMPAYEYTYYDSEGSETDMFKLVEYPSYELLGGRYVPSSVKLMQKHSDDREEYWVTDTYSYDAMGDVVKDCRLSEYLDRVELTTEYTRDAYGNVLTELTSGDNVTEVTKCHEYDGDGLRLTKSYTVPASSVVSYEYDKWGNVIAENDESNASDILSTYYSYDNWGALVRTVNPDSTFSSTTTEWDSSVEHAVYRTVSEATAKAPVTTYFDSEGREVYSASKGLGGIEVNKTTHYTGLGKVGHVMENIGKRSVTLVTTYDAFGRPVFSKHADGSVSWFSYDDRSVTEKGPRGTCVKSYDAWGNVVSSEDNVSSVSYDYNSLGKPSCVTSGRSSVDMMYDAGGNRTLLADPDAGEMTYKYAADGKILEQTDGKGVTTTFSYDKLGREVKRVCGSVTEQTQYGKSGNSLNRVTSR